jgi:hypothetical protein
MNNFMFVGMETKNDWFTFSCNTIFIQIGTLTVEIRPKESIRVFVEPFKLLRQVLVCFFTFCMLLLTNVYN